MNTQTLDLLEIITNVVLIVVLLLVFGRRGL